MGQQVGFLPRPLLGFFLGLVASSLCQIPGVSFLVSYWIRALPYNLI